MPTTLRATTSDQERRVRQGPEVDGGAGHAEEEGREDRGQRLELVLELVTRLGLGHDEPGHEGADDGGQADKLRDDGQAEGEHEGRDERRVGEERPGEDLARQAPGSPRDREAESDEADAGDRHEQRRCRQVAGRRTGDDADEDERQDVVDDGGTEDDARERPVEDAHVGQHAAGDADAGRRQRQADEGRRSGRLAGAEGDGSATDDGQDHGQDGRGDRGPADGEKLVGADLQPDGEEQDDHAQERQELRGLAGHEPAERVGPDEEAARELADDARLTEPSGDLLADLGSHEEDEEADQGLGRGRSRRRERRRNVGRSRPGRTRSSASLGVVHARYLAQT